MAVYKLIKLRRDYAANWTTLNPVLSLGEPGYERDTGKMKIGDGVSSWDALDYIKVSAEDIVVDPEEIADIVASTLQAGPYIDIDYQDASDVIVISATGVASEADLIALSGDVANLDAALVFKGFTNPVAPNSAPLNNDNGDVWISNTSGIVDGTWTGAAGETVVVDQFLVYASGTDTWTLGGKSVGVDLSDYVLKSEFEPIKDQVIKNSQDIFNLSGVTNNLDSEVNALQIQVNNHDNSIIVLQSQVDSISGLQIPQINANIGSLSGDILNLEVEVGNLENVILYNSGRIDGLEILVNDLGSSINTVSGELNGIRLQVQDNSNDIVTISGMIVDVEGGLNTVSGNLNTLTLIVGNQLTYIQSLSGLVLQNSQDIAQNSQDIQTLSGLIDGGLDFKGYVDPTVTGTAPSAPNNGDLYISTTSGTINTGWSCLVGSGVVTDQWLIYSTDDSCFQLGPANEVDLSAYALKTDLETVSGLTVINADDIVTVSGMIGDGVPTGLVEYSTGLKIQHQDTVVSVNDNGSNYVIDLTDWKIEDGHMLPISNANFDIGSAERKVRHLFLSDNSLYMGEGVLSASSGSVVLEWNGESLAKVSEVESVRAIAIKAGQDAQIAISGVQDNADDIVILSGLIESATPSGFDQLVIQVDQNTSEIAILSGLMPENLADLKDVIVPVGPGTPEDYAAPIYSSGTSNYTVQRITPVHVEDSRVTPPLGGYEDGSLGKELTDMHTDISANTDNITAISGGLIDIPNAVTFRGITDPTVNLSAPSGAVNGDMWVSNNSGLIDPSWSKLGGQPVLENQFLLYSSGLSGWLKGGQIDVNSLDSDYLPLKGNIGENDVALTGGIKFSNSGVILERLVSQFSTDTLIDIRASQIVFRDNKNLVNPEQYTQPSVSIEQMSYDNNPTYTVNVYHAAVNEDTVTRTDPSFRTYKPTAFRNETAAFTTNYQVTPFGSTSWDSSYVLRDFGSFPRVLTSKYYVDGNAGPMHVGFESNPTTADEYLDNNPWIPSGYTQSIGFYANYNDFGLRTHGRIIGVFINNGMEAKNSFGILQRNPSSSDTCNTFESPTSFGGDAFGSYSAWGESLNINKPTDMVDIIQGGLRIRNAKLVQPTSDGNVGQLGWDQFGLLCYTSSSWKRAPLLEFTTTVTNPTSDSVALTVDGDVILNTTATDVTVATDSTTPLRVNSSNTTNKIRMQAASNPAWFVGPSDTTFSIGGGTNGNNQLNIYPDVAVQIPTELHTDVVTTKASNQNDPIVYFTSSDVRINTADQNTAARANTLVVENEHVSIYSNINNSPATPANLRIAYPSTVGTSNDMGALQWQVWNNSSEKTHISLAEVGCDIIAGAGAGNEGALTFGVKTANVDGVAERLRITKDDLQAAADYVPQTDYSLVTKEFLKLSNASDVNFPPDAGGPIPNDSYDNYVLLFNADGPVSSGKWEANPVAYAQYAPAALPIGGYPSGSLGEKIESLSGGPSTLPISSIDGTVKLDGASNVLSVSGAVSSDTGSSTPFRAISSTDSAYYKSTANANGASDYWAGAISTSTAKDYRIATGAAAAYTALLINEKHGLDYVTGGTVPVTRLFSQDHDSVNAGSFLVDYNGRLYATSTKTTTNSVARNSAVSSYAKVETGNTRVGYSLRATYWGDTTVSPDYPFQGISYLYGFYSNPVIRDIRVTSAFDFSAVGPQSINSSGTVSNICGFMVASNYGSLALPPSGQEKVLKYGVRSDLAQDIGSDGNHKVFNFFGNGTAPSRFIGNLELAGSRLRSSSATSNELFFSGSATVHEGARIIMRPRPDDIDPNVPTDGQYYLQFDQPRDFGSYAFRIYQFPSGQSTPLASAGYGATVMYTNNTTLGILGGSGINFNGDANSLHGFGYTTPMLKITPQGDLETYSTYAPATDNSLVDKKFMRVANLSDIEYPVGPSPVSDGQLLVFSDINDKWNPSNAGTATLGNTPLGGWPAGSVGEAIANAGGGGGTATLPISSADTNLEISQVNTKSFGFNIQGSTAVEISQNNGSNAPTIKVGDSHAFGTPGVSVYTSGTAGGSQSHYRLVSPTGTDGTGQNYSYFGVTNPTFSSAGTVLTGGTAYVASQIDMVVGAGVDINDTTRAIKFNVGGWAEGNTEMKIERNKVMTRPAYNYWACGNNYDIETSKFYLHYRGDSAKYQVGVGIPPSQAQMNADFVVGNAVSGASSISTIQSRGSATIQYHQFRGDDGYFNITRQNQNGVISFLSSEDSTGRGSENVMQFLPTTQAIRMNYNVGLNVAVGDTRLQVENIGSNGTQKSYGMMVGGNIGSTSILTNASCRQDQTNAQGFYAYNSVSAGSTLGTLYCFRADSAATMGGDLDSHVGYYAGQNITHGANSNIGFSSAVTSGLQNYAFYTNAPGTQSFFRGNVGVGDGASSPQVAVDVHSDRIAIRDEYTPAALSSDTTGEIAWDEDYIWVRTTAGWKKSPLYAFDQTPSLTVRVTQAEYDGLTPDPDITYVIVG